VSAAVVIRNAPKLALGDGLVSSGRHPQKLVVTHSSLDEPELVKEYVKTAHKPLEDGLQRNFDSQHQKENGSTSVSDPHEVESRPESFREYRVKSKAFSFFWILLQVLVELFTQPKLVQFCEEQEEAEHALDAQIVPEGPE